MGLLELCDRRRPVPGRAQAAAVVQAQQGVLERHRHLRLDHVASRERRFGLGGRSSGYGQVAPAAGKRQGGRRQPGRRYGVLELAERGLGVVKSPEPISASASMALQLKMPGRPPTPRSLVARTGSVAASTPARSPRAKARQAPATAAQATARTSGNCSAAARAAPTCACAAGHWPRKARTWAERACARARSSGRSVSWAIEVASWACATAGPSRPGGSGPQSC